MGKEQETPEEIILYKVVEKGTRHGTNLTIFLSNKYSDERRNAYRRLKRLLPEHLRPRYLKGRILKSHPDTVGFMCFRRELDASRFISDYVALRNAIIIKVKGILRENQHVRVHPHCGSHPRHLLREMLYEDKMRPAFGTVFCDQVEVLE